MKRNIILLASAAAIGSACAQDLSTEITVDRIVVPELRGVHRLSVTPSIYTPAGVSADIAPAEYTGSGSLSNMLGILSPAPWRMSTERTPYRGYVSVGAFPGFNAAADAGYRFVDNGKSTVGTWFDYDGAGYKHDGIKVKNHIGTLGAYASFDFGAGRLSIDATGMTGTTGGVTDLYDTTENIGAVEAHAGWEGAAGNFSYNVSAGGHYLHMSGYESDGTGAYNGPVSQAMAEFGAGGGACHSGEAWRWVGMDIDGAVLKSKGEGTPMGQYHFRPFVAFEISDFHVRLGAKLSVGSGNDKPSTRIAPDVALAYAPERGKVGAQLSFTGGETLNPLLGMFERDPFINVYRHYGRTNIPVGISGSLHFGRFAGFGAELRGAFTAARNLLLPVGRYFEVDVRDYDVYRGWNANTWKIGADVNYAFRTLFVIGAGGDVAGSSNDTGRVSWYEWADRARAEARAYVHATPLAQLDVNIDYVWRHKRRSEFGSLGAVRSLDLSGAYRITPALTASLQLSNLLCHRYLLVSGLPSQGIHGLVGVSYKF